MMSSTIRNLKSSPHEMAGSNAVQPGGRMEGHAPRVGKAWQAISRGRIKQSVVLDIFAGSNTTGSAAAELICNMKSAISNQAQRGAASTFRFVDELPAEVRSSPMRFPQLPVQKTGLSFRKRNSWTKNSV
jgi:hypothetical protein